MSGKLYLCATPIGNLEDITLRVLRTLKEVDLIAAEDTRNSTRLLNHFEIKTPMTSYHEHNKIEKAYQLVDLMGQGKVRSHCCKLSPCDSRYGGDKGQDGGYGKNGQVAVNDVHTVADHFLRQHMASGTGAGQ